MANDLPDWASTVYQPDVPLAGSPMAFIAGFTTQNFAVPNGVHIINIVLPTFFNVSALTVAGVTSGNTYLQEKPNQDIFRHDYWVIIPGSVDTTVTIDITSGSPGTAYVSGVLAPIAVAALPQNPAPWQAPNTKPSGFTFANPGAGNTVVIVAAPPSGESLWLHDLSFFWSVAMPTANGHFQDGAGQIVMEDAPLTVGGHRYMHYGGVKLSGSQSFLFKQAGAAAAGTTTCYGAISYAMY